MMIAYIYTYIYIYIYISIDQGQQTRNINPLLQTLMDNYVRKENQGLILMLFELSVEFWLYMYMTDDIYYIYIYHV